MKRWTRTDGGPTIPTTPRHLDNAVEPREHIHDQHQRSPRPQPGDGLVRVTEAAAMAAGRWAGRGDKNAGDGAAVDAMRELLSTVSMRGVVVIGEARRTSADALQR